MTPISARSSADDELAVVADMAGTLSSPQAQRSSGRPIVDNRPVLRTVDRTTGEPAQAALPDDDPEEPLDDPLDVEELDEDEADEELELPAAAGVLDEPLLAPDPFEEADPVSDDFDPSDPVDDEAVAPAVSDDLPLPRESVR